MSDIEKSNDKSAYEKYESLLLQRDALKKEAGSYQTAYIKEFGELINKVLKKKIDCISKKKSISFCQAALNRGKMINARELQEYLKATMSEYNEKLSQMIKEYKIAKASETSSEFSVIQCKIIYRRIAKLIHPDINPTFWGYPEIKELWHRTMIAYGMNDDSELQAIEVLVHKILDENGFDPEDIVIENIEERIDKITVKIQKIITTDPYLYRELLESPAAISQKKRDLEEELKSYEKYSEELSEVLKEYIKKGVIVEWEEN